MNDYRKMAIAKDAIAEAQIRLAKAEQDLQTAAQQAKEVGLTWRDIGLALGVTAQAAHAKFKR